MALSLFQTAWDPTDLPGTSVDPLGFEPGYLWLADRILPGLTNAADSPRYFSMLCAGASLAPTGTGHAREDYAARLQVVLRFERIWAVANVLGARKAKLTTRGLRGVTFATDAANGLSSAVPLSPDGFDLLSRQVPYGAIGIYGAVASGLRFWDRKTLRLTPDLGAKLAEEWLAETRAPQSVLDAAVNGTPIPRRALTSWGQRAHIAVGTTDAEARRMADALRRDPVRARMARLLARFPEEEDDVELVRLERIAHAIDPSGPDADIAEAIAAIGAYEACYRRVLLVLQRLVSRCRAIGEVSQRDVHDDPVLAWVLDTLPPAVEALKLAVAATSVAPADRLGALPFLLDVGLAHSPEHLAALVLRRHTEVQHGKTDGGRRKLPWIEQTESGALRLTVSQVGGRGLDIASIDQIPPHIYRTHSADALIEAAHGP